MAPVALERPIGEPRLDESGLLAGCEHLAETDDRLAELIARNGIPPLRLRAEGYATLVLLILQQQVSRQSAAAVFSRLGEVCDGEVTAPAVLRAADDELRSIGFSRQKITYTKDLAAAVTTGELDLAGLEKLGDADVLAALTAHRGIGEWTAAVYALTALARPDMWVPADRALLVSMGRMLGRPEAPPSHEAAEVAAAWSPWRAVAARILWHDYSAAEVR